MSIMNRRNAALGWTVWQVGKRMAKKKAKSALPGRGGAGGGAPKGRIVSALAAVGGVLFLWRRKRSGDGDDAGATQG